MSDSVIEAKVINAPIESVYKTLSDFEKYSEFIKEISKVEILEKLSDGSQIVRFHADIIKEFSYDLHMKCKPFDSITWTFVRGDVFKENQGTWIFEKIDEKRTKATYSLKANFGVFVPKMIVTKILSQNLPKMFEAIEKRSISL